MSSAYSLFLTDTARKMLLDITDLRIRRKLAEYIDKLKKIEKEKTVKVKDFRQHFGLDE